MICLFQISSLLHLPQVNIKVGQGKVGFTLQCRRNDKGLVFIYFPLFVPTLDGEFSTSEQHVGFPKE